jgi:hypothetical protein
VLTISFGMVLFDILFANLAPDATLAFKKAADLLLWISLITLLSALAAIAFSWKTATARNLLIASLIISLSEFLIPAVVSLLVQNTNGLAIGPWLRIIPGGVATILAFMGLYYYYRRQA